MSVPLRSPQQRVQLIALLEVAVFAVGVTLLGNRGELGELGLTLIFSAVVMLAVTVGAIFLVRRERSRLYVRWLLVIAGTFALVALLAGAFGWGSPEAVLARSLLPFAGILTVVLFDSGRPTAWADRWVTIPVLAVSAVILVLIFATSRIMPPGLVVPQCDASCASGWLNVTDAPGVGDALARLYLVLRVVAVVAMSVGIVQRLRSLTGVRRTEFVYLGVAGILWAAGVVVQVVNQLGDLRAYDSLAGMYAAQFVLRLVVPVALCAGLMVAELRRGSVLEDEFARIRAATTSRDVRDHLRVLLEDDSLDLVMAGAVAPDTGGALTHRAVTELRAGDGRLVATVMHRPDLAADAPAAVALGMPAATSALERIELTHQIDDLSADVASARAAALAAGDSERARIERDLHDGAQARIVLLRGRINRLAGRAESTDGLGDGLRELGDDLDAVLAEVRSLASGLRPLAPGTLVPALRDHAGQLPIPVRLRAGDLGDLPSDVELAVYFCIREALQNVLKHAGDDAGATVVLRRDGGRAWFSVEDDGCGVPADGIEAPGSGIAGMRARMEAVGGLLDVRAAPGGGTCVTGEVLLQAAGTERLAR